LLSKPERKGHLEELGVDGDNKKASVSEIGCDGVEWIHLA
jgi:hypothetical protein